MTDDLRAHLQRIRSLIGPRRRYPSLRQLAEWLGDIYFCESPKGCRQRWDEATHKTGRVDSFGTIHISTIDTQPMRKGDFYKLCKLVAAAKEPRARPEHAPSWMAAWWQAYLASGIAYSNPYKRCLPPRETVRKEQRRAYRQLKASFSPYVHRTIDAVITGRYKMTETQRQHLWHWVSGRKLCYASAQTIAHYRRT